MKPITCRSFPFWNPIICLRYFRIHTGGHAPIEHSWLSLYLFKRHVFVLRTWEHKTA